MTEPDEYSFIRYLAAKKSVDNRALNRRVWDRLVRAVRDHSEARELHILELGAGIGTMVERMVAWGLFTAAPSPSEAPPRPSPVAAVFTAIDAQTEQIAEARRRLPRWAAGRGMRVADAPGGGLVFENEGLRLTLELEAVDLVAFAAREAGRRHYDLVVAHALLDLLDVPRTLAALRPLVEQGGHLYAGITFDGGSVFQPETDRALDDQVEALYHRTMDRRIADGVASGGSRTGRTLFHQLRDAGLDVLEMGGSDWVVFPSVDGYGDDEAYFLHFIIHTVGEALRREPELAAARLAAWLEQRHAQIERGELVYIAHQLDVLARFP